MLQFGLISHVLGMKIFGKLFTWNYTNCMLHTVYMES